MRKVIILSIAAFLCSNTYSQKYDHVWVFGDSAGLNFNFDPPENFISSIFTYEACASIADSSGDLLFYTNGEKVWNKEHEIMHNGDDLNIGLNDEVGSSLTQGVLILPFVNNENKYYIFQIQRDYAIPENYGIEYSIVDMTLDDGLGDVAEKNSELYEDPVTEKMQAVKHGNGKDWWLITSKLSETDFSHSFLCFLITDEGIEGPFEQIIGSSENTIGWGEMNFNSEGSKLIYSRIGKFDLFDFDRCTGLFSNWLEISNLPEGFLIYSSSFSETGNKIYVSTLDKIYQYCFDCDSTFTETQTIVFDNEFGGYSIGQMQLGPDNRIYAATCKSLLPNDVFNSKNQNLCVINFPDLEFPDCDFDTNTVSLGERRVIGGLPNMPNYNLGALAGSPCDTLTAIQENEIQNGGIKIYPNPARSFIKIEYINKPEIQSIITTNYLGEKMYLNFNSNLEAVVSALPAGMYFIQIITQQEKMITQWMKF